VPDGGQVGLRFRSRDPEALADVAGRVLGSDRLRDDLVSEAREHVLSFDWLDVAERTASVYERLLGERVGV
jgi:glycogen(starch) synthase